jgi:hypothetical protein
MFLTPSDVLIKLYMYTSLFSEGGREVHTMRGQTAAMDSDTLLFAVLCIEGIAEYLNMDGAEVYRLLTGKGNILDTYILEYCDVLHTQSKEYIVDELVGLMKQEGLIQ